MTNGIIFHLYCLAVIISVIIIYFSKPRVKSVETKFYLALIFTNIIVLMLHIFSYYTILHADTAPLLNQIVTKSYLFFLTLWIIIFSLYIVRMTSGEKVFKAIFIGMSLIMVGIGIYVIACPIYAYNASDNFYTYGPAITTMYKGFYLNMASLIIYLLFNFKKILNKRYIPVFLLIILGAVFVYIQQRCPWILLTTALETFVVFIMYFTIENPDIRMIEQLNIAREQADKANSAKSEFLSSMSHEIRTPLNAIVGFSQALCEEDLNDQARDEVNDIMMASETLLDIVNGILDISKIEANKLEIVNTEYSLKQIFDELVSLSKARLGEKPLDFKFSIDESLPKYFYGDKVRVKQVILNLLTNSIKYTHEGWIDFKITGIKSNDVCRLIISVEDSGIGIKPESIDKLFSKFERLDIEKNNTIEGTGLGLAITKKLIDLMGGKIVVQSVYGQGSKFTIALDQKIVENPTIELDNTKNIDVSSIKPLDLTNKRILIVDDNKVNLKVASRLLQDYHCIIDTLDSGQACIDKINFGATYDLILMDDMMPKMSGVETFHKLQEIEGFETPVIALTANAISGMKEKYLSEGFNSYLSKPIDKGELNKILNEFLG